MEEAIGAHALGEAVYEALADLKGGFGGDVARSEAGAAGGEDEGCRLGVAAEGGGDQVELVGEGLGDWGWNACLLEEGDDDGAGEIDLLAPEAAVADGEDDGAGLGGKDGGHRIQFTVAAGSPKGQKRVEKWELGLRKASKWVFGGSCGVKMRNWNGGAAPHLQDTQVYVSRCKERTLKTWRASEP